MNPKTLGEAQNFASETEMWIKGSHQSTKQKIVTPRPPIGFIYKRIPPPRTLANTTPQKAYNQSTLEIPSNEIPSNERSLIRARYRSLQRAADQPLFPHYYGIRRARI